MANPQDTTKFEQAERLRAARIAAGYETARAAAEAMGAKPTSYTHHENGTNGMRVSVALKYAQFFGVRKQWLLEGVGDMRSRTGVPEIEIESSNLSAAESARNAMVSPLAAATTRNFPVLGIAAGSLAGSFVVDGVIDFVHRPPALIASVNAYAVYVRGTSMSPKHDPGDLLFVNPDRPAAAGDSVIIQTKNSETDAIQSWVKILKKTTSTHVVAEQLNPPATIEFDLSNVVGVHRVMKMAELF